MQYRTEIDGLRAVAIVPVILFHAEKSIVPGGFLGVDIFFVISGFLITSIILNEMQELNFSLIRFYERRARRILPALFLVIGCCIPFAWIWMTPDEFGDFRSSILWVALFLSNVFFWRETDYFAFSAELTPLLHTWTLAVEEQYYIFFPVFVMLLWRFGARFLILATIALLIASLTLAQFAYTEYPVASFFLSPTRIWELMAGSICAMISTRFKANDILALFGFAIVIASLFHFDINTPTPSIYTVIPVLGASLIILFAKPGTIVARLLSVRIFVGIGLVSFSLYLWHQPVFAFARIRLGAELTTTQIVMLIALVVCLSCLSWKFVEQPFRRKTVLPSQNGIFAGALVCSITLMFAAVFLDNSESFWKGKTDKERLYLSFLKYYEDEEAELTNGPKQCSLGLQRNSFQLFDQEYCLQISSNKPNYLLIGDSHAGNFYHTLANAFPETNFIPAISSGCRPLMNYQGAKRCTDLTRFIFEDFLPRNRIDGVILSSRWDAKSAKYIAETVDALSAMTSNVIVFGPLVEYNLDLPLILGAKNFQAVDYLEDLASGYLKDDILHLSGALKTAMHEGPGIFISIVDAICRDGKCRVVSDIGEPMAYDYGHLTYSGSQTVIKLIRDQLPL